MFSGFREPRFSATGGVKGSGEARGWEVSPSRRCDATRAARIASPGVAVVGSSMGLFFEDERPWHLGKF